MALTRSYTIVVFAMAICTAIGQNGAQEIQLLTNPTRLGIIRSVALSHDGGILLMARAGGASVWDTNTGDELHHFTISTADSIGTYQEYAAVFSPDQNTFATGGDDGILRLWDLKLGKEKVQFKGRQKGINSLAFSRDGHILTGSLDGTARLLDTVTGKQRVINVGSPVSAVAFSPNGRYLVTDGGGYVHLWEASTERESKSFTSPRQDVTSFAFSSDSRFVVTGSLDGIARLWDVEVGTEVWEFATNRPISSIAMSPDGGTILTGSNERVVQSWNAQTHTRNWEANGYSQPIVSLAYSSDGRYIATAGGFAMVLEAETGREIKRFSDTKSDDAYSVVSISPDGQYFLTNGTDKRAMLWAIGAHSGVKQLHLPGPLFAAAFSSDGHYIATSSHGLSAVLLWDLNTGQTIREITPESSRTTVVAFSPDSRYLLTSGIREITTAPSPASVFAYSPPPGSTGILPHNGAAAFWRVNDGGKAKGLDCTSFDLYSAALSPDGLNFIGGSQNHEVALWNTDSGTEQWRYSRHSSGVGSISFSRDSSRFVTGSWDGIAKLSTVIDPNHWIQLDAGGGEIKSLSISPNQREVAAGLGNGSTVIWDGQSGKKLRALAYTESVNSIGYSVDSKFIVAAYVGGTTIVWNTQNSEKVASLFTGRNDQWLSVAPDGRFDSDNLEDRVPAHWVAPDDPLRSLVPEIFMRDYYEPRLLPRLLACHAVEAEHPDACKKAFPPVRDLASLNRVQPGVKIIGVHRGASADEAMVEVEALGKTDPSEPNKKTHTDAYDLRLFRDGELVAQWPEPKGATNGPDDIEAWRHASQVPTARHSFTVKLPSGNLSKPVEFKAYAFNEDRVKSEAAQPDHPYKLPADTVKRKPRAYVITVGVNKYQNPRWNLEFAAKDAEDISGALRHIKDYEVVPVTLVSEASPTGVIDQATKANIHAVLRVLATGHHEELGGVAQANELAQATPDDLVILSFSGHGYTEKNGAFYLLPSDANSDEKIPATSLQSFISSEELSEWLRDVDAGQLAMIIDACHSAASVNIPGFKPGPMGDRGLGQLAYDKGMSILAASQADDVALEIESLHQGLLTYALREGLIPGKNGNLPAASSAELTLQSWLKYAEQRVPGLYDDAKAGKVHMISRDPQPNPNFVDEAAKRAQTPSLFDFSKQNIQVQLK
jgi:WD40 repeat protein